VRSPRKDRFLVVVWAMIYLALTLDMFVFAFAIAGCKNSVRESTMEACKKTCAPRVVRLCTDDKCECESADELQSPHEAR
jgi:hypothetical protein